MINWIVRYRVQGHKATSCKVQAVDRADAAAVVLDAAQRAGITLTVTGVAKR